MSLTKTLLAMAAFLILFAMSGMEAKAQCDPGWTEYTIPMNYPNCPGMTVTFCVYCSPTSVDWEFEIKSFDGVCDPSAMQNYIEWAVGLIKPNYDEYCTYVDCDEGTAVVVERTPLCWYQNDEDLDQFLSCNLSWCETTYEICTEDDGTFVKTKIAGPVKTGTPCPDRTWDDEPEPSECFKAGECGN